MRVAFTPDRAASSADRIARATEYVFEHSSRMGAGRFELATGIAEVVLGGGTSTRPGKAAFVVGLARYENGQVVYEHHLERWRDTETAGVMPLVGALAHQLGVPEPTTIPTRRHDTTCIPNLGGYDCIRLDASTTDSSAHIPQYILGQKEPTSHIELPEAGRLGVARMIERFATGEYDDLGAAEQLKEAFVVMGAAAIFRDPAMNEYARIIAS